MAFLRSMNVNGYLQGVAAVVLLYGGQLTLRGELSRAGLVSFMFYQASLASAMGTLSDIFSNLMAAVGAAVEVVRLLRRQPAHPECGSLTLQDLKGHIEFQGVTFSYPTRLEVPCCFTLLTCYCEITDVLCSR
jgi:ABC-type bacteriocin/lantibiotic exporter with double-glycine peptidase domain